MRQNHFGSKKGFSLIELMVVAGIGMTIALSITSLISTSVKASRTARTALEYANMIALTKKTLDARTDCSAVLGQVQYDGNESDVPFITVNAVQLRDGDAMGSSGIQVDDIKFEQAPTAGIPISLIIGGVTVTYNRFDTQLLVEASRTDQLALGGAQIRPVPIPVTLYVEQVTNNVRYCAGNDETQACSQIGGNYIPGDPANGTPPSCDIRPAVGGCLLGGSYSLVNNRCASGNPYTGSCSCRNGFGAYTVVDYRPNKQASLTQRQCMNCAGGAFNPNLNLNPLYNNNQLQQDLLCIQDPAENCPCQHYGPQSPQCICFTNPQATNCDDPCYTEPNGCTCLIATNGFPAASQDPVCQAYFGQGFMSGFIGGFIGGINP